MEVQTMERAVHPLVGHRVREKRDHEWRVGDAKEVVVE